jgi:FlaA1/EpsC-like NDP-sugar epimerase
MNNTHILLEKMDFNKLLDREPINIDNSNILPFFNNDEILITGGCGSIGSEIVRQLLLLDINNLIIYDHHECGVFDFINEINKKYKNNKVKFILGDINDNYNLENVFLKNNIKYVFHSAAYKHVNIIENNSYSALRVNIIGTKNISDLSIKYNINKFIMISTDKAVNPTSVMGASKRIAELYINSLNKYNKTEFITTRFGNVLGSSGSVIPTFIKNINNNENIKITHPEIIRYFMTIPEAAQLVLHSCLIGKAGEILLFDMGKPVKIIDLAKKIIDLYGSSNIKIEISSLCKGEKIYEELLCKDENILFTENKSIMKLKHSDNIDYDIFIKKFDYLISNKFKNNNEIINMFKEIIPEYNNG